MSLSDPYDQIAGRYESHIVDSAYNAHYDRPAVLQALGEVAGLDVLDAACGPGVYSEALFEAGARVTAFDGSPQMVALASERSQGRWPVARASFDEPIPYAPASVDRVVCALAIHYAADRGATFAELRRVLRPGGRCVVSTQHPQWDWLRKGGSYFDVTLETDTWGPWSGEQEVTYWREPLGALCDSATDNGFLIRRLIEPLPAKSLRERDPKTFDELSIAPAFLILDLVAV